MASSTSSSPYPFASAPDIIRAQQKDAYFTGHLANTLTDLHRRLLGARAAHALGPELRTGAALLYFALTTLPGNRTLGEEYCDLVQIDASSPSRPLPQLSSRAGYIAASILLPYLASRSLPAVRARLRKLLERRLETLRKQGKTPRTSGEARVWEYATRHLLPALASSAPIHALTLSLFYFGGSYYELSKRFLSLRYVFTRTIPDTPDRAGYEVLGVLLVVQLAVQAYLHVRTTLTDAAAQRERAALQFGEVDVSLDHDNSYSANSALLMAGQAPQASKVDIATTTHTPMAATPRFNLRDEKTMAYVRGAQQRKCTLCLEELKDPSATQCGHVFCWECIGDWVREKPECPLCRREAMVQHILPLRVL